MPRVPMCVCVCVSQGTIYCVSHPRQSPLASALCLLVHLSLTMLGASSASLLPHSHTTNTQMRACKDLQTYDC